MSRRSIVIVGAGHAGVQAAASLREEGSADEIALLSGEAELPYQRPPLSKAFLKGEMDLAGLAVNLALKIGLYQTYGAVGLASATAVGAWINFALLILLGLRRDWMRPDAKLIENIAITTFCSGGAAIAAPHLFHAVDFLVRHLHFMRNELDIVLTGVIAIVVYLLIYMAASRIFGRSLRGQLL